MPGRFNDGSSKMDGFNMNVVGLTIERPLNEDLWAAGYRVDLLFGPDAVGYNPVGDSDAELAIKQAYANLHGTGRERARTEDGRVQHDHRV
jgi:hypothetical protein